MQLGREESHSQVRGTKVGLGLVVRKVSEEVEEGGGGEEGGKVQVGVEEMEE